MQKLKDSLREHRILGPLPLGSFYPEMKNAWLVAVTESRTPGDLERLAEAIEKA
jgi:glycine dehydrogenase subunit 1